MPISRKPDLNTRPAASASSSTRRPAAAVASGDACQVEHATSAKTLRFRRLICCRAALPIFWARNFIIATFFLFSQLNLTEAIQSDGSHHAPVQPGQAQTVATLRILGDNHFTVCNISIGASDNFPISDTCAKPQTNFLGAQVVYWARVATIKATGHKPLAVISGQVCAVRGAYYADTVELSKPVQAPLHELDPGALVTIHGAANLVLSTRYVFHAPTQYSAHQGMGRLVVKGELTSTGTLNQIDVKGDVEHLPITLITYKQISGNWRSGVIPPGTKIQITANAITLIRARNQ